MKIKCNTNQEVQCEGLSDAKTLLQFIPPRGSVRSYHGRNNMLLCLSTCEANSQINITLQSTSFKVFCLVCAFDLPALCQMTLGAAAAKVELGLAPSVRNGERKVKKVSD